MFASAIDMVVSLENDGVLVDYMTSYLEIGEPYLTTEYSTAICYWDAILHYALYWVMLYDIYHGYVLYYTMYFTGSCYMIYIMGMCYTTLCTLLGHAI